MESSVYTRPSKPLTIEVRARRRGSELLPRLVAGLQHLDEQRQIEVDSVTECHVTPPIECLKLCKYSRFSANDVFDLLEPQAGTGNILSAAKDYFNNAKFMAIERHSGIFQRLSECFSSESISMVNGCFLEASVDLVGSFDLVLSNPPFKYAKQHIEAAYSCLKDGGELIAIVPVTFKHKESQTLEVLGDVFANTKVNAKIIKLEKTNVASQ